MLQGFTSPYSCLQGFELFYAHFARRYFEHLGWFLFLRLLRCFNSAGSQSFRIVSRNWHEVAIGYLGFNGCMRLSRAFRSLLRPSSVFQTKPSNKRHNFLSSEIFRQYLLILFFVCTYAQPHDFYRKLASLRDRKTLCDFSISALHPHQSGNCTIRFVVYFATRTNHNANRKFAEQSELSSDVITQNV